MIDTQRSRVYLIGGDIDVSGQLSNMLQASGINLTSFETPEEFRPVPATIEASCLVFDLGSKGGDPQQVGQLHQCRRPMLPIIVVAEAPKLSTAIQCMKLGAVDVLEKPVSAEDLAASVQRALSMDVQRLREAMPREISRQRLESLSDRERELLDLICIGCSSKQIAIKLKISSLTVANHRKRLLKKTGAANAADLVRLAILSETIPQETLSDTLAAA